MSAGARDRCSIGAALRAESAQKCVPQLGNMMQMMSNHVGYLEEDVCMMNTSPHATSGSVRLQKMDSFDGRTDFVLSVRTIPGGDGDVVRHAILLQRWVEVV